MGKAVAVEVCAHRLESTNILAEIEEQRKRLRERKIVWEIWDAAELDLLFKAQAEIVDDFFGRPHAECSAHRRPSKLCGAGLQDSPSPN